VAVISRAAAAGMRAAVVAGAGTSFVIERVRQRARMAEGGEKRGCRWGPWTPLARAVAARHPDATFKRALDGQHSLTPTDPNASPSVGKRARRLKRLQQAVPGAPLARPRTDRASGITCDPKAHATLKDPRALHRFPAHCAVD
jgi:hypothetical protein